jgi:hypothetical protein
VDKRDTPKYSVFFLGEDLNPRFPPTILASLTTSQVLLAKKCAALEKRSQDLEMTLRDLPKAWSHESQNLSGGMRAIADAAGSRITRDYWFKALITVVSDTRQRLAVSRNVRPSARGS